MKILTMLYRRLTFCCIYCGTKKERYDFMYDSAFYCPTDMNHIGAVHRQQMAGCSVAKKFIQYKEAKVQRALGLFSGPKGF